MRALTLARLAAKAEGRNANSIDDLIAAELLPAGFGHRADGSKLVQNRCDGSFPRFAPRRSRLDDADPRYAGRPHHAKPKLAASPISSTDMQSAVGQFAPVCAALKRTDSPAQKGWDRITADVRIAPYSQMPIARWPNMLGPAATDPRRADQRRRRLARSRPRRARRTDAPVRRPPRFPHAARRSPGRSHRQRARLPNSFARYIGGWPRPHLIDRFIRLPDGPARCRQHRPHRAACSISGSAAPTTSSCSRSSATCCMEVGPQLAMVEAEHPAQIRLHIDDLSEQANRHRRHRLRLHARPRHLGQRQPLHELAHHAIARAARKRPPARRIARRRPLRLPPRRQLRPRRPACPNRR